MTNTKTIMCAAVDEAHARTKNLTNEQFGKLFRRYMEDSIEQDWEGYSPKDLIIVEAFLKDLATNYEKGLIAV